MASAHAFLRHSHDLNDDTCNLTADSSFNGMLRVRDEEYRRLESENFDLKLKVYHLEQALTNEREQSRDVPDSDNFYSFEESPTAGRGTRSRPNSSPSSVEELLRAEVAKLRETVDNLQNEVGRLERDVRTERGRSDAAEEALNSERAAGRDARAAAARVASDLAKSNTERVLLREELEKARQTAKESSAKAEGASKVLTATGARLEQARTALKNSALEVRGLRDGRDKKVGELRARVAQSDVKIRAAEVRLGELRIVADKERKIAREAKKKAEEDMEKVRKLEKDVRALEARLTAEAERRELEFRAREKQYVKESDEEWEKRQKGALEELEDVMNGVAKMKVLSEVDPRGTQWKEKVLTEINQSLSMLYCFQRQVEKQRDDFVEQYTRRAEKIFTPVSARDIVSKPTAPPASKRVMRVAALES